MKSLFAYYYARNRRDLPLQEKQRQIAATALDRLQWLAEVYARQERQATRLARFPRYATRREEG